MSSLHHYTKEELVKLKRKYDMEVSKEAIEEIKHTIDLDKEIERLTELCNKYEEEHKTTFETWKKDIKENKLLHSIIKELERDLESLFDKMEQKQVQIDGKGYYYTDLIPIEDLLNKVKTLKGSDKG